MENQEYSNVLHSHNQQGPLDAGVTTPVSRTQHAWLLLSIARKLFRAARKMTGSKYRLRKKERSGFNHYSPE